ncbi:hypothetical protein F4677DRAFT_417603 [Hypoxylon crocopeplum]|nr:hypothetical protein F4677DRAFT_417603 [Hypoxylon crocopeplum]
MEPLRSEHNPYQDWGVPQGLHHIHDLQAIDQTMPRRYTRLMLIFDFPVISRPAVQNAITSIVRGLEVALSFYPFLAGRVGPLIHPNKEDLVQLRYGDDVDGQRARPEIFGWRIHDGPGCDYMNLCGRGMPVSHLSKQRFCASPTLPSVSNWPPALTLQANFLKSGGLVLCLAVMQCVADDWSIGHFLHVFRDGIRGSRTLKDRNQYRNPGISGYIDAQVLSRIDLSSGMKTINNTPQTVERNYSTGSPRTYIFKVSTEKAKKWRQVIVMFLEESGLAAGKMTIVDCLSALIWVEITRIRQIRCPGPPNRQTKLYRLVDVRDRLFPSLGLSFFGNMHGSSIAVNRVSDFFDPTNASSVSVKQLAAAVVSIHQAAGAVNDTEVRILLADLQELKRPVDFHIPQDVTQFNIAGIKLYSLLGINAYIDYGIPGATSGRKDGRPRWVRRPWLNVTDIDTVYAMPRRRADSDWEFLICLGHLESEAFRMQLEAEPWGFTFVKDTIY